MQAQTPNLIDQYFDFVLPSEAPILYHRWCLLTGVGAMLGRNVWLTHGHKKIYPQLYTVLLGAAGSRKSTAIYRITGLMSKAGHPHICIGTTTKAQWLIDLSCNGQDADVSEDNVFSSRNAAAEKAFENLFGGTDALVDMSPREAFIAADELVDFLGRGNMDFISVLTTMWDGLPEYRQRLKNSSSIFIPQPTVSMLSGTTQTMFTEIFPPQIVGQGMLSRLLLVFGEPVSKEHRIAWPAEPSDEDEQALVSRLVFIRTEMQGEMVLSPAGKEALTWCYLNWNGLEDKRFESYSTRRHTQLLRTVIICAVCRNSMVIEPEDVILANTILKYTESLMPKALGEFGKSKNSDVSNKIMDLMYTVDAPQTIFDIWQLVHTDLDKMGTLVELMVGLVHAGKVQVVDGKYLPIQKALETKDQFVDFSLLRELKGD